jgi:hypothetical protein
MASSILILTLLILTLSESFILKKKTYENSLLYYGALTVITGLLIFNMVKIKGLYIYVVFILATSLTFMFYQMITRSKSYLIINFSIEEGKHFDELNDILKAFCRRNHIDKFYIELSVGNPSIVTFHNINKGLIDACMIDVIEYASNNLTEQKKNTQISRMIYNILFFAAFAYLLISVI